MTTWAKLIDQCENAIDDESNSTWNVDQIIKWINDAVRDYSNHFPRTKTDSIALTTGTSEYDLDIDFLGVLSVEYPDGEDPREYLLRRAYTDAEFWNSAGFYDIIKSGDVADDLSQIVFSEDVATGETAVVQYQATHDLITDNNDLAGTVTVPEPHQPLLVRYIQWQATVSLAFAEQQSPTSNSSLLMAQLAQNARRLEMSYSTALQQVIYASEGLSRPMNWMTVESGTRSSLSVRK